MSKVPVSVIIPTYKRPELLSRALESVLSQDYENIEAVVVDDNAPGSPERVQTQKIMGAYFSDARVKYIQNDKSLGGGPARNRGITAAKGEYIAFLDDDDKYLPGKISTQLNFTVENGLDMSFTDLYIHDSEDRLLEYRKYDYSDGCEGRELLKQHILHHLGSTPTVMVKKEKLLAVGGFPDVPLGQDFFFMWRMIESGAKISHMHGAGIIAYIHPGERISSGLNKINGENKLYELKRTHFDLLNAKEKRYVRFRHYAVLSVSYKRSGNLPKALLYGAVAVLSSPVFFIKEAIEMRKNKNLG